MAKKNKRSKRKSVSNKINNKFKNMLHNFNTISIKGSERKNLTEIDEKEKENGKDIIKNKKNDISLFRYSGITKLRNNRIPFNPNKC